MFNDERKSQDRESFHSTQTGWCSRKSPHKEPIVTKLVFNANEKHGIRLGRKLNTSPLTDVKEETDETQHTQHKCAAARKPVSNTDVKHYKRNCKKKVSKLWDANSEENKELRELNSEFCPFFLKEFKKSLPLSSEFMSSIQFHHGTKYKKLIIATFSELNLNVAILTFFSEQIKICSCLFFFYPVRNMLL